MRKIEVVDSHTGGEPTRLVVAGGPDLGSGTVAQQLEVFRDHFDTYRSAVVNEPRGSDVMVGALICPSQASGCSLGVIFFNNVGYLGMCGHGTIGLIATLAHMGKIKPGNHSIETSVGIVQANLNSDGSVSVTNVGSYRTVKSFRCEVPGIGMIQGDIAWGGNWFFLVDSLPCELTLANVDQLTDYAWRIRQAVNQAGYPEVDHVELFGDGLAGGDSRNFVLCPGKAYDRSPCGTGTSAKLACLAADGKLQEGETWIQESILGSKFTGSFQWSDRARGVIAPVITGEAFVCGESTLLLQENDPFCWGIRSSK